MEEVIARFFGDLLGRLGGIMWFRLILEPSTAAFFAIRGGLQDARMGRPAYTWAILADPSHRMDRLREGWNAVAKVFGTAIIIDAIYQYIRLRWFYPFEALFVAFALACVPYLLIRGPAGRFALWWHLRRWASRT
jgi:hypothetical protein